MLIANAPVKPEYDYLFHRVFGLTVFSFLIFASLLAQEPTSINYTIENGLLSNEVYDLFEDKDGFIWMGTNKGVIRFNSDKMQAYTINDGLADRDVLEIDQDSKGNIWFLSYNGKLSYWKNGTIYNEKNDERLKDIASASHFTSFHEDRMGNLWFGTYNHGIFRINTSNEVAHFTEINPPYFKKAGVKESKPPGFLFPALHIYENAKGVVHFSNPTSNYILNNEQFNRLSIHEHRQRRGWFHYGNNALFCGTYNKISLIDVVSGKSIWKKSIPLAGQINGVELLSDGLLYVATDKGVFSFDQNGNKVDRFLVGKQTSDILIDWEGNLWVSTLNSGIFLLKNRAVLNYNTKAKYSILQTKDSILFGGLGMEIHSLTKKGLHLLPIEYKPYRISADQDKILTFTEAFNHQIWFGSYGGLFQLEKGKATHSIYPGVKELLYFNHTLFVSTSNGYLFQLDTKALKTIHRSTKLNEKTVFNKGNPMILNKYITYFSPFHCMSNTNNDYFFLGTNNGIVHYKDSTFRSLDYLPKGKIVGIKEEKSGNLWLLEKNRGLYYYQEKKEKLDSIALFQQGDKILYTTLWLEKDSSIWVGTDKGLVHVESTVNGFSFNYINKKNGLVTEEINDLIIVSDTIWLATSKGISFLPKSSLKDSISPLLYIDSIVIAERAIDSLALLNLSSDQNTLAVYFTGVSFKDEGELRYAYQLKGNGNKVESGIITNNLLILRDLYPYRYTLLITAIDANGNRSESKKVHFSIRLRWWKNWKHWAIIMVGFLLVVVLSIRLLFKKSFKEMYALLSGKGSFTKEEQFITVRSVMKGINVKIPLKDLYYIKVSGDYTEFFKKDKMVLVRASMKSIEEELAEEEAFVRVHKSYLVNLKNVEAFKSDALEMLNESIPIARRKREEVKNAVSSLLIK